MKTKIIFGVNMILLLIFIIITIFGMSPALMYALDSELTDVYALGYILFGAFGILYELHFFNDYFSKK